MKIAIVCDWLVTYAGAERVLEQMLEVFPEADLFALVDFVPAAQRAFLHGKHIWDTGIANTCSLSLALSSVACSVSVTA